MSDSGDHGDFDPRSGVHGAASSEYPDLRHGTRGEPVGRPAMASDDLELQQLAERRAAEDEALGKKTSFWKRLFGRG